MRYIDAEKLQERMYHEAFEKDSDLQKWESGCWIRYKLFENCLNEQPTADVVEVVRCKDCKWYGEIGCAIKIVDETDKPKDNDYCSFGERSENGN